MQKIVNTSELAKKLKVSRQTISKWISRGMPRAFGSNPRGGKRPSQFNFEEVLAWLNGQNIQTLYHAEKAAGWIVRKTPETANVPEVQKDAETTVTDINLEPGMMGAVERLKQGELEISKRLIEILRGDIDGRASEIMTLKKVAADLAKEVQMAEMRAIEYQEKIGKYIEVDEVKLLWRRVRATTRQKIMSAGDQVAPKIRPMLHDPKQADEVQKIVNEAIVSALRPFDFDGIDRAGV